jgi:hypothetical protein
VRGFVHENSEKTTLKAKAEDGAKLATLLLGSVGTWAAAQAAVVGVVRGYTSREAP